MPEAEAAAILYRDDSLMVRHFTGNGGPTCVVTFDSFTDISTLDRLAFGETLFLHEGIDAVHVLSSDNRWYQYAAMADAAAAIRAVTAGYDRVVTYGSSMGGYAALRLAGLVGATVALALSPQWSIDWRRAPWERRWAENSRSFEDVWERSIPPPALAQAWVVYDPLLKDRRHVRKLRREGYVFQPVEIPGGGHPVGSFLAEVGLLRPAVMDVIADRFDPGRLQREAARRRPDSAQALLAQSSRLPKARIQGRLELLARTPTPPLALRSANIIPFMHDPMHQADWQWPGLMTRRTAAQEPRFYWRGRALGGSSVVNAQIAIRGVPDAFDGWAEAGCEGGAPPRCCRCSTRSRTMPTPAPRPACGKAARCRCSGRSEPIGARSMLVYATPALASGYAWQDDLNAPEGEGVACNPINSRAGLAGDDE